MNIDVIREFITLADMGSYEEAAFHLFTTQSSLSKHIQGLEAELGGLRLLNRGHGKIELTEFGKQYYPYASKIIQLHDDFMNRSPAGARGKNTIRIGFPPHMDAYGFSQAVQLFCQSHPECSLLLEDEDVVQKLHVGDIDIGIFFEEPVHTNGESILLTCDRLVPVLPASHPLAGHTPLRISELRDEPFVFFSPRVLVSKYCRLLCQQAGFEPRIMHTIAAPDCRYLLQLVAQNFGISIVPEKEARYWSNPDISIAQPDMTYTLNVCAQCAKEHTLTELERELIEFLQQQVKS